MITTRINVYCTLSSSLLGFYTCYAQNEIYTFLKTACVYNDAGKQLTRCEVM